MDSCGEGSPKSEDIYGPPYRLKRFRLQYFKFQAGRVLASIPTQMKSADLVKEKASHPIVTYIHKPIGMVA